MKRLVLAALALTLGAALSACATPPAAAPPAATPPAEHAAATPPGGALGGPASRTVDLPGAPGAGAPREARVLVDEPALKLASIVLRAGTVLPTHTSDVPVTITALRGSGAVVVGAERLPLDATHAVVLAPNVPHAVEPATGTDLVLLVHHLGRGAEHHH